MPSAYRRVRSLLKGALLYRHWLALFHRIRNRNTLTVVAFHRVLSRNDPRWPGALPEFTVSTGFFEQCLLFFRRHYNPIGIEELAASAAHGRQLPPRSLLITF